MDMDEEEVTPTSPQQTEPVVADEDESDGEVDPVEETDLLGEDDGEDSSTRNPTVLPANIPEESDAVSSDAIIDDAETCDSSSSNPLSNQGKEGEEGADSSAQEETQGDHSAALSSPQNEGKETENDDLEILEAETANNRSSDVQRVDQVVEDPAEVEKESGVDEAAASDFALDEDIAVDPKRTSTDADQPEGISLESNERLESEDEEIDMPMIRVKQAGLFAEEDEDEDQGDQMNISVDPDDIHGMMQLEMNEDSSPTKGPQGETLASSRPRRAAAAAAANVIREITSQEEEDTASARRRKSKDAAVDCVSQLNQPSGTEAKSQERHRCHACKKVGVTKVVVRQYGQDIFFCTSACFNSFRNPDSSRRPLPCAKCGIIQRDSNITFAYYWETMNFCSDLCVGNHQMEIGSRCATCIKKVAWASLGKYCVRFGSDVRQFCSAFCLETYKKNARVCFHCQLDIKKLSNVILANIPAKTSPKEFCSQDCVEMYIEQNLHQTVSRKPNQNSLCGICSALKITFRELVLPTGSYKVCSEFCWTKLLEVKNIRRPLKCEICTKYVNLELGIIPPAFYVSTEQKVYGFCSATCKNVYVLRSRQILACTTCKVKKYNYDLIEYIDENQTSAFAVCSLNCIPKPSQYILSLRETLTPIASASEMLTKSRQLHGNQQPLTTSTQSRIRTTIVSNSSNGDKNKPALEDNSNSVRISGVSSLGKGAVLSKSTGDGGAVVGRDDDIIEICEGSEEDVESSKSISEEEMNDLISGTDSFLVFPPKEPVEQRNKACLVRPFMTTVGTQADSEALHSHTTASPSVKEKFIPIFIPVFIPFPFYALEFPAPIPLPVPIPVPIPLPVMLPTTESRSAGEAQTIAIAPIPSTSAVMTPSPLQILPQQPLPSATRLGHPAAGIHEAMRMDSVGFLELAGPNVGESDSFDILNTIPSLDMDLDLGATHDSTAVDPIMNQGTLMTAPSNVSMPGLMRSVVDDLASSSMQWSQENVLCTKIPPHPDLNREQYALSIWVKHFGHEADPLCLPEKSLNEKLMELLQKGTYLTGEQIPPYMILYVCLGLQQYLRNKARPDKLFYDPPYQPFVEAFVNYAISYQQGMVEPVVDENHLWDALELGVNCPEVLVFTLVYYNYKYFHLRTWQEHAALQVNDYVVSTKSYVDGTRYKSLSLTGHHAASQSVDEMELSSKCFIKLFEFYKFKCTISDSGPFYKHIIPRSPLKSKWYSAEPLSQMDIYRMLIRAMMIKG